MASPLLGPAGNAEYFLHARALVGGAPVEVERAVPEAILDAAVRASPDLGGAGRSGDVYDEGR
jgi:hypothetical protein